jgi:hypothetical protein
MVAPSEEAFQSRAEGNPNRAEGKPNSREGNPKPAEANPNPISLLRPRLFNGLSLKSGIDPLILLFAVESG